MCKQFNISQRTKNGANTVIITYGTNQKEVIQILNSIAINLTTSNYEENKTIIMQIYDYFYAHMRENTQYELLMDIGYTLTDIFERNGEYDKSVEIAREIIKKHKNHGIPEYASIEHTKKYLNEMIGCAYSIAIAKKDGKEKEHLLNQAESLFKEIEPEFNRFINDELSGEQNTCYISGLYYSDYGAFFINKGDYFRINQPDKNYINYYTYAKKNHEEALRNREKFMEIADATEKQEAQLRVGRSKRNIGSAAFRLGDYKNAVKCQKDAIEDFDTIGNKEEKYTAVDYLTGGYIAMWESNINDFLISDFTDCCRKLSLLREYYSEGNSRYETAIKRIGALKQIIGKLAPDNQSSARSILTIILEDLGRDSNETNIL